MCGTDSCRHGVFELINDGKPSSHSAGYPLACFFEFQGREEMAQIFVKALPRITGFLNKNPKPFILKTAVEVVENEQSQNISTI